MLFGITDLTDLKGAFHKKEEAMVRYFRSCIIVSFIILVAVASVFSQAAQPPSGSAEDQASAQAAPAATPQSKETAIYGEVQAVNIALNTFSVQYYDYDSDSEKTAEIVIGKDAKMENVKALGDIKKGDWVDVTYTVLDGHNTARMVSVEKEELATEPTSAAAADMPSGD